MSQKTYYPSCDEVDLSDEHCPNCDHACFTRSCSDCGGDGWHDAYELDPLWYDEGDTIPCDMCQGNGYHHWCPKCNWDMLLPDWFNTPRHRGMAMAKFDPRLAQSICENPNVLTMRRVLT